MSVDGDRKTQSAPTFRAAMPWGVSEDDQGPPRHGNADPSPARGTSVAHACTVSTRSGAVCVRGFVLLGVRCRL